MRTLAHISDLHFGRTDPKVVEALAQDLIEKKPSVIVVSGDLTQRARPWQYREAAAFLKRLPKPQIVIPGNHDIPLYDVIRRFFFPHQRYLDHISPDLAPMYRDEELFIIGLNTARAFSPRWRGFWKDGWIGSEHLLNLCKQTENLPESVFKVVVTHHPFIPPSDAYAGDVLHGAAVAIKDLRRCKVDLLLAGHLHMGYCGDAGSHHRVECSILSVQAGSATSTRRREKNNAYNWIEIQPDHVNIEIRASDGGPFAPAEVTTFRRTQGVWQRSV